MSRGLNSFKLKSDRPRCVIDIRKPAEFDQWHLPGAINFPLNSLDKNTTSPFSDSGVLEKQWLEIEGWFSQSGKKVTLFKELKESKIRALLVCYTGNTSRVATSVLRAKGVETWCIRGGCKALIDREMALVGLCDAESTVSCGVQPQLTPIRIN